MRKLLSAAILLAPVAASASANEILFDCALLPATSSVVQTTDLSAPFSGTFIGDYDATNNPSGTRTIPGLFGGSGNNPINYTASFVLAGDINSTPLGAFTIGVDPETLQVRIGGLNFDLLGPTPLSLGATLNMNYQTFRTQQPNSLFPGGVNIPIPVGNGSVTELRATQSSEFATGAMVPQKNGSFDFAVTVPVDFVIVATLLGQTVSDGAPQPGVLPITGNVVVTGNSVTVTATIANKTSTTQPISAPPFADVAFPVPTVLPAGSTANLLLSGTVTSLSASTNLTVGLSAAGKRQPITGDLNSDYSVNLQDLEICLSRWGLPGLGDLDGSGFVGSRDVTIILHNWQ